MAGDGRGRARAVKRKTRLRRRSAAGPRRSASAGCAVGGPRSSGTSGSVPSNGLAADGLALEKEKKPPHPGEQGAPAALAAAVAFRWAYRNAPTPFPPPNTQVGVECVVAPERQRLPTGQGATTMALAERPPAAAARSQDVGLRCPGVRPDPAGRERNFPGVFLLFFSRIPIYVCTFTVWCSWRDARARGGAPSVAAAPPRCQLALLGQRSSAASCPRCRPSVLHPRLPPATRR